MRQEFVLSSPRPPDDRGPRFVSLRELVGISGMSESTLRRLWREGKLGGHQPGGPHHRVVFPPDAVERASIPAGPATAADAERPPPPSHDDLPLVHDARPRAAAETKPARRGPLPRWARRAPFTPTKSQSSDA